MALPKQIIRENATYANLINPGGDDELQLYMIGIATDTDEFIFRSDDGYHRCLDSGSTALSEHSIPFINASGKVAQDNTNLQFNDGTNVLTTYELTTLSDINAAGYIKRSGVDDDYIRLENDKASIGAGGVVAMVFEDDQVYSGLKKFGFGKTTLEASHTLYATLQIGGNSSLISTFVEGANSSISLCNNLYNDGESKRISNDEVTYFQQANGIFYWRADAADTADVAFSPTERMRLTSADLSTASVQLGLGTSTPLLNVGSATGDFTGDGIHIKSDVANDRSAYIIAEGDITSNMIHHAANLLLVDNGADADQHIFKIGYARGICDFGIWDDVPADGFEFKYLSMRTTTSIFNPSGADIDFEVNTDDGTPGLKVDAGARTGAGDVYVDVEIVTTGYTHYLVWNNTTQRVMSISI